MAMVAAVSAQKRPVGWGLSTSYPPLIHPTALTLISLDYGGLDSYDVGAKICYEAGRDGFSCIDI